MMRSKIAVETFSEILQTSRLCLRMSRLEENISDQNNSWLVLDSTRQPAWRQNSFEVDFGAQRQRHKTADYVTDKQAIRQRAEKCSRTQKKTKGQGQVDSLPFRFPS